MSEKVIFTAELEYDAEIMHDGDSDAQAKDWFFKDILRRDTLLLHSNEIGDTIGAVKILEVREG